MRGRLVVAGLGCALVAGVAAVGAGATGGAVPQASALVMTVTDVPGSKVLAQRALKATPPVTSEYQRILQFATPYGTSKYRVYASYALVVSQVSYAQLTYRIIAKLLSSPAGRKEFVASVDKSLAPNAKVSHLSIHPFKLGTSGMEESWVAGSNDVSIVMFQVDRVLELGIALGSGVPNPADALALGTLVDEHVAAVLGPAVVTPPIVTGTPQQGQTLGATTGTWTNSPTGYAYQWQRCDATGANCADIPGATQATYVPTSDDAGSTLVVVVTATNADGSVAAASAPTAAVT